MDWIDVVEREGRALSVAARHDFRAAVPACPGWDVDALLTHQALVHHRTAGVLRTRRQEPYRKEDGSIPDPPHANHLAWYEAGLASLLEAMREIDPTTPVWTFDPDDGTAAFWFRRMAHETLVHRIDAEQATGAVGPVDAALAADGIDELLGLFLRRRHGGSPVGNGETIHVHATDVEGEWLVTLTSEGPRLERGHAKGDAAARGPAPNLHRWLWGRGDLDGIEVFGDAALADRLPELAPI